MKALIRKMLPEMVLKRIDQFRFSRLSDREKRAHQIGLGKKAFKKFMDDPDAALNTVKLHLFGAPKKTHFLKESKAFIVESVFDDVYHLEKLTIDKNQHCKIVDIGANVGAFAIAARCHFPHATIHCYEPNQRLEEYLKLQAYAVQAKHFIEAVGSEEGYFSTDEMCNEILNSESVTVMDFKKKGNIKTVSLKTVIERIGGHIDLLKLDCEGSEWTILKDYESMRKVRFLTFEYHRLAPDGSFDIFDRSVNMHEKAEKLVAELGFEIIAKRGHHLDAAMILAKRKD